MKGIQRVSLVWNGYNNYTVEFSTIDGRLKTVENPESVESLITIFEEIFEGAKEPIDTLVLRELEVQEKERMIQEKESELVQKEAELLDKEARSTEVIEETKSKIETLLDNETINSFSFLFDKWEPRVEYNSAQKVSYNNKLYKVLQSHISQVDWTPDIAPALFKSITQSEDYQDWHQPTGAHDAYADGDLILFEEHIYRAAAPWTGYSIVHSPSEMPSYWSNLGTVEEYENPIIPEEHEPGSLLNPIEWSPYNGIPYGQVGSEGIYAKDTHILFEGEIYISLLDNNHWTPTTYPAGWEIINE